MTSNSNVRDILAFLRELAANNDRAWFKARKDDFDKRIRLPWIADIERLIAIMSEWEPKAVGLDVKQSVYRIYRDTRFSPDKTPYKNHFGAVIGRGGRHCVSSGYYIHLEPEHCMLCGGVWWPERDKLEALRRLIDAESEEFARLVSDPALTSRFIVEDNRLKKVPREFPQDHPMAEWLKQKAYIFVKHLNENYFDCDDWVARVNNDLRPLKPVHDFLDYVYDEE